MCCSMLYGDVRSPTRGAAALALHVRTGARPGVFAWSTSANESREVMAQNF